MGNSQTLLRSEGFCILIIHRSFEIIRITLEEKGMNFYKKMQIIDLL